MWNYFVSYMRRKWVYYALVAPFLLMFTVFTIIPVAISIYYSFTYYNLLEPPQWVWAENYIRLFTADDVFLTAIRNTFIMAAITGPVSYFLCFGLAWLINNLENHIRSVLTLIFYAPSISGAVFVIWTFIFSGDSYGLANSILMRLGIFDAPIQWLTNTSYMMIVVIIVTLWMSMGTSFLAFAAGLKGIDRTWYEAGAVEGIRNRWQELWYITLPLMRGQLMFGAVMQITASFSIGDVGTALMGNPSVDYATHTVMNHLQDFGSNRFEFGYSSAIAVVLFLTMVTCNQVVNKLLSRVGE